MVQDKPARGRASGRAARAEDLERVELSEDGLRLDRFLAARRPEISRARLQRAIRSGQALLNGAPARPAQAVRAGDRVALRLEEAPPPEEPRAEPIPLAVVYEDEDLLVLDKPAGLVVHPAGTVRQGTLVNALLARGGPLSRLGGPSRPGIVHRLDKGTSGLMLVAKRDQAHAALAEALRRHEIRREYWALIWGTFSRPAGTMRGNLGRDERRRTRMAVRAAGGRAAVTHYRLLRGYSWVSEVGLRLETGRTHQIRVHLAHEGHPVFGDGTYGGRRCPARLRARERALARELLDGLARPALHAARLTFVHPATGREMDLRSPLPADLAGLVARLGEGRERQTP